jgi:outer membrane protein OmpA-like peptidoglycan-associated protein
LEADAMTNLMDTVKELLTPETIHKAADQAGESPEAMGKAMHGAVPTAFAGLAHSAAAPGGAGRIFGAVTERGASSAELMNSVFGDRSAAVRDALAKSSGVSSGAASHALSMVLPMAAAVLGKHLMSKSMTAGGLSQMLSSHKEDIANDPNTPPGLAGALDTGSETEHEGAPTEVREPHPPAEEVSRPHAAIAAAAPASRRIEVRGAERSEPSDLGGAREGARPEHEARRGKGTRWGLLVPIVLLGALLAWGISSLTRGPGRNVGVTAPQPTTSQPTVPEPTASPTAGTPPPTEAPAPPTGTPTEDNGRVALPDGNTLDVAPNSTEAQMAHALANSSTPLPHAFAVEHLTFDFGSSTMGPEAARSTDDLAMLLRAYPSARIRILGNTDSSGTEPGNQALSDSRANVIKDALVAKGIASERVDTAGEAARRPAPGTGPENAANRRALVVLLSR